MSAAYNLRITAILINFLTFAYGDPGNFRAMEMQNYPIENERHMVSLPNTIYYPNMYPMLNERNNIMQGREAAMEPQDKKPGLTYNDFMESVNDLSEPHERPELRSAKKFASPASLTKPIKFSFDKPNYAPWPSHIYTETPTLLPAAPIHTDGIQTDLWKPRFGLFESGMKPGNKLSGLLNLFLALAGGSDLTGIKDVFINSILKPLLVSKRGLKAIISKLSIPVVALVLVNVEILVVVWWLWEECPEPQPLETPTPFSQNAISNISSS